MLRIGFVKKETIIEINRLRGIQVEEPDVWYEQFLELNTNWLIINLYEIDEDIVKKADERKLKKYNLENEPINWGDLKCDSVDIVGNKYVITITEASPDCVNFKEYIRSWLKKWGWDNIEVITEWSEV